MKVSFRVKDSVQTIARKIAKALGEVVNIAFKKAEPNIERRTKEYIEKSIKNSPEYESMINGQLKGELGFVDGHLMIDPIIDFILSKIEIKTKKVNITSTGKGSGGITLKYMNTSAAELTALPYAAYASYGDEGQHIIEWLDWMLLKGDKIIVRDWDVTFELSPEQMQISRSKMAVMTQDNITGKGWQVNPAQFRGTINDNFITRAIANHETIIENIIEEEVNRAI